MPVLTITKNWADGESLEESELDDIKNSIETFINTTKLDEDNLQDASITTAKIVASAVTTVKLASGAVTTAKITDANVTTAKIADNAITTAKIPDDAITTAKIPDDAITTAKIPDDAITTAKIADNAVTRDKLEAVGEQKSSTGVDDSTTSASASAVTGLSETITTSGRPVFIGIVAEGGGGAGSITTVRTSDNIATAIIQLRRDPSGSIAIVAEYELGCYAGLSASAPQIRVTVPCCVWTIDTGLGAGTYTYDVAIATVTSDTSFSIDNAKLIVFEL